MKIKLQRRLLMGASSIALAITLLGLGLALVQGAGTLIRVTFASDSERDSFDPSLSADGMKIAFSSDSDLSSQGIPIDQQEIWLYDANSMAFTRVTEASSSDRVSKNSHLSANGMRIAFASNSDFLNQGVFTSQFDIWLYDTATMTVTRVSTASGLGRDSFDPKLNANGTRVVFYSDSDFFGQSIPDGQLEIWLYDTNTKTLSRVTTASDGDRDSLNPKLSADGTKIVFHSDSDVLSEGIPDNQREIWLYNTNTTAFTRITTASAPGRDSFEPSINPDGTKIVFRSDSDFLGQGIPEGQFELWLYDTNSTAFTRLTTASASDRASRDPTLTDDGTLIMFRSDSDFLGEGIPNNQNEIWLFNTLTKKIVRVTTASDSNRSSGNPSLSGDGRRVAFESDSDFLGQGIPNDQDEVWFFISPPFLTLDKTASPVTVLPNDILTYKIFVANSGVAGATSVVITDALDSNVSFASASDGGIYSSGIVTWNVGALAPAQIITRTLQVTVNNIAIGSQLINTAWVTSAEGANASGPVPTNIEYRFYLPVLLKLSPP